MCQALTLFKLAVNVNYHIIQLQVHLLSLTAPTRTLDTPFDPTGQRHPMISWVYKQNGYVRFDKPPNGPRIMHLHGNGNPALDIAKLSRLFYVAHDPWMVSIQERSEIMPEKTVVYFEFDRRDSRYNNLSSMLLYFINTLAWRFCPNIAETFMGELTFLRNTRSWSLEDLYHLYCIFRDGSPAAKQLTFFISCIDQCPEDQRGWFLERVLDVQKNSERGYRVILSTSDMAGLAVDSFPDYARINLDECPALRKETGSDAFTKDTRSYLNDLITARPIFQGFQTELDGLLMQCHDVPYLRSIVMNWLRHYSHGVPKAELAEKLSGLSPVTPQNLVHVFMRSLGPDDLQWANIVFNLVKHAAEPWSPESLTEALAMQRFSGGEPSFDDLDPARLMRDIERVYGGIIVLENRDIKFSHMSFYELAEIGVEGSPEERAAKVNSTIAEACLRYFWLDGAKDRLLALSLECLEGGPWATLLDASVIVHQRTSMAEYAVRFWPQHYKASGQFRPTKLVYELFSNREARGAWEGPFYALSNPFTRIQRTYVSSIPVFAMLGLEDMVIEQSTRDNGQPLFEKDCWFAITEAARAGNNRIVQWLLQQVAVDANELPRALFWAASRGKGSAADVLLEKIPDVKEFCWPDTLLHRAAASGLDRIIETMGRADCNVNEPLEFNSTAHTYSETGTYSRAPPAVVAAWWNQTSTIESLLSLNDKVNLEICNDGGDTPLLLASQRGNPRIIQTLLQGGASVDAKNRSDLGVVHVAIRWSNHKALELLLGAKAGLKHHEQDGNSNSRPPLIDAVDAGSKECVRLLLAGGADPNIECASGSALYKAVADNNIDIVRMLLENDPKANLDMSPSNEEMLLIQAVCTGDTEIVSLLIQHGAEVDFVDPNAMDNKTPLSRAAKVGNIEMVKLLLAKGADVNFTGEVSDPSLFTALYYNKVENARLLLEENGDVSWTDSDGWNCLHAAYNIPQLVPDLLKKGGNIESHCPRGTILHMAARHNCSETIAVLLEHRPKPDLELVYSSNSSNKDAIANEIGCTALLIACHNSAAGCVKLLLEAGADPHFRTKDGDDAAAIILRAEYSKENEKSLKLLLSHPYKISVEHIDEQGNGLLHKVERGTPASIVRLMIEAGTPVDNQNEDGHTPLAVAIKKGNVAVAKLLVDRRARVNVYSPSFGSLLHLACLNGSLELVRLLIDAGANLETVDLEYGESLLYTALGIEDSKSVRKMVRFLVDTVKVPINKLGGRFGYPIIRAANMSRSVNDTSTKLLKFLVRRNAKLEVADDQGRRAVHHAAKSGWDDGLRTLVEAGAAINPKDKFGRMPIHFAASSYRNNCTEYLLSKDSDTNIPDYDNWTPLLWAIRSGHADTITQLIQRNADIWIRGRSYDAREWSPLKLTNFTNRFNWLKTEFTAKERTRVSPDGQTEEWDGFFHKSKRGEWKDATCWSCLVVRKFHYPFYGVEILTITQQIIGIQWKCITCIHDVSFCFKCCNYRSDIHNADHIFEEIGPLYDEGTPSSRRSSTNTNMLDAISERGFSSERMDADAKQQTIDREVVESDENVGFDEENPEDVEEFDPDSFD